MLTVSFEHGLQGGVVLVGNLAQLRHVNQGPSQGFHVQFVSQASLRLKSRLAKKDALTTKSNETKLTYS